MNQEEMDKVSFKVGETVEVKGIRFTIAEARDGKLVLKVVPFIRYGV